MKKAVAIFAISLPVILNAQGFQVSLQGQRQQGMGGAGTAMITDGASLFYNPGGVSFLSTNSASAGATAVISHVQYRDAASSAIYNTESPAGFPFTAYAVFGKKNSKLKYGIAAYTPFGSTIDWQDGWAGRFITTRLSLASVYIQPTVSYKISDKVGFGAGFVYGIGKMNLQRDIPIVDGNGNYSTAELSGNSHGFGFNAGLYYQPTNKLSFGLTYRSAVNMKLDDGKAEFTVPASLAASFPSGKFTTELPLPSIGTLGIGYKVNDRLSFAFDASLINWKTLDTLTFDYETNTNELQDTKSPRKYENASAFRLGAEYSVTKNFDLRGGIKYLVTPIQDGYVTPDVPDASHLNYSLGFGYKLSKRLTVDASFTLQYMERTDENVETGLSGTYKTAIYMPGISLNYKF
jgi:long-chain fatty acid transport protein